MTMTDKMPDKGKQQGQKQGQRRPATQEPPAPGSEFLRAANEDDDGYDPYSDRRPDPEPLFERDPWG